MNTPIVDFVKRYQKSDTSRFHMPGHKGVRFLGCEPLDITEINGADVLYDADGIIAESEQNATALFGTAHTYYSAEGSSLAIKAMLAMVTAGKHKSGERPLILAARNVHKSFIYACALLDLDVELLYPSPDEHLCSCTVLPADVEKKLYECKKEPAAVYLTSPDYLGQTADVERISAACKRYDVPLLVDNAHGAYLRFLQPSRHPISLGADLCCDSAHKTLPVLTGGAYLHISKAADPRFLKNARNTLSMFASTSPSYLILQSLDLCNRYLADGYPERLTQCANTVSEVKRAITAYGFAVECSEPLKIVLDCAQSGLVGTELATLLRQARIEPEFADRNRLVLMVTPETRQADFDRLTSFFARLAPQAPRAFDKCAITKPCGAAPVLSIREAIFAPHERIPTASAQGRICASPTVSCPPAIPIAVSGERITADTVQALLYYGIDEVDVVI